MLFIKYKLLEEKQIKKQIKITSYRNNMFFFIIDKILLYKKTKIGVFIDNLFKFFSSETYKILYFYKKINNRVNSFDIKNIPLFRSIEIETINRCNGKCSFCPVNINELQRPFAKMDEILFKKIIDELSDYNFNGNVYLFSNNEPFLDDRIFSFAEYANTKLPNAIKILFSNGTLLNIDKCKKILPYIDRLVLDNYNDELIMNSNIKEIYEYFKYDDVLGKKIVISMRLENEVLSSRGGQAPNKKNIKTLNSVKCILPFSQIVIRPTGHVSLCCNDPLGKNTLGNVNINTLKEIWYSNIYKNIRIKMKEEGRKSFENCKYCDATIYWK